MVALAVLIGCPLRVGDVVQASTAGKRPLPGRVLQDIKSPNVLLGAGFTAKIADVGLAKLQKHDYLSLSAAGGTFTWSAPELLMGQRCTEKARFRPEEKCLLPAAPGARFTVSSSQPRYWDSAVLTQLCPADMGPGGLRHSCWRCPLSCSVRARSPSPERGCRPGGGLCPAHLRGSFCRAAAAAAACQSPEPLRGHGPSHARRPSWGARAWGALQTARPPPAGGHLQLRGGAVGDCDGRQGGARPPPRH